MSKYYKAEDVQTLIKSLKCYGIPELNLDGLPTIEVSEDCISREGVLQAIIICETAGTDDVQGVAVGIR